MPLGWEELNHSCKIIITAGLRFTLAKGVLSTFFLMRLASYRAFRATFGRLLRLFLTPEVPSGHQDLPHVGSGATAGHGGIV